MVRVLFLLIVLAAVTSLFVRSPMLRHAARVAFGVLVIYSILKATGAVEAIFPARDGVF
jgi:hypothetical protein